MSLSANLYNIQNTVHNLLCIVDWKVGNGNWGIDLDQSLALSVLLCSLSSSTVSELLQSGLMDCSFALFAQCLGRGGGRGNRSSMSVSWSSPVSVLDATEVRFPKYQRNVLSTKINPEKKKKSPGCLNLNLPNSNFPLNYKLHHYVIHFSL